MRICVLEALLEYEFAAGGDGKITESRLRGEEYLLDLRLFRRFSTGGVIDLDRKDGRGDGNGRLAWAHFAFPTWWHDDFLLGLDYLRKTGATPDKRGSEAIAIVEPKRSDDGRRLPDCRYTGTAAVEMDEIEGQPSRRITLHALGVLNWNSERN
jgi:hypothetical protein